MEVITLTSFGLVLSGLMVREAWAYLRWRRDLSRIDRGEWTRTIRELRNQSRV